MATVPSLSTRRSSPSRSSSLPLLLLVLVAALGSLALLVSPVIASEVVVGAGAASPLAKPLADLVANVDSLAADGTVPATVELNSVEENSMPSGEFQLSAATDRLVSAPYKVIYIDFRDVNDNNPAAAVMAACNGGYNVVMIAFWMRVGPEDLAQLWAGLSTSAKQAAVAYCHARGAIVMASVGGAEDAPYELISGAQYGTNAANWAVTNQLDGVDFDMENFDDNTAYKSLNQQAVVAWLVAATNAARAILGSSRYVSHAPQAPYFGTVGRSGANPTTGTVGGYSAVYQQAAAAIDFLSVQFYNQGRTCYTTYVTLFTQSNSGNACGFAPGTSVAEIASYGVPLDKIVVGKYLLVSDADNGFVSQANLAAWVAQARSSLGWNGGVMCWAWQASTSPAWIAAMNLGSSVPTTAPTSAPTTAPTTRPTTAPTSTPTTAPTTRPTTCTSTTYTVVAGDTLNAIATAHGVTLAVLMAANPSITNANLIEVGDHVTIPASTTCTTTAPTSAPTAAPTAAPTTKPTTCASTKYTIVRGDTLLHVATSHSLTLAGLLAANPAITNANVIYIGQVISLPSAGCSPIEVRLTSTGINIVKRRGRDNETDTDGEGDGTQEAVEPSTGTIIISDGQGTQKAEIANSAASRAPALLAVVASVVVLSSQLM